MRTRHQAGSTAAAAATTATQQQPQLPKWAQVSHPKRPPGGGSFSNTTTASCNNARQPSVKQYDNNDDDKEEDYEETMTATQVEDQVLSTLAYHAVSNLIEDAYRMSLDTITGPVHQALDDLLQLVASSPSSFSWISEPQVKQPTPAAADRGLPLVDCNDDVDKADTTQQPNSKKHKSNNDDDLGSTVTATTTYDASTFTLYPTTNDDHHQQQPQHQLYYDALLLPIFVMDGPFDLQDRVAIMSYMIQSTRQKRPRSCVVTLSTLTNIHSMQQQQYMNRPLLPLILQQLVQECLLQEPNPALVRHLRNRRRKQMASSNTTSQYTTDTLVEWATLTQAFDGVVVFVHIEEGSMLYTKELADFIQWMASRRATYKIPLSMVLLRPQKRYRRDITFRSNALSPIGCVLRQCQFPPNETILSAFWDNLYQRFHFPFVFPVHFLNDLYYTFTQQNGSVVKLMSKLRQYIAHRLATPGSFLSVVRLLGPHHSKRITSLIYSKHFRALVSAPTATSIYQWLIEWEVQRCIALYSMEIHAQLIMLLFSNDASLTQRHCCFMFHKVTNIDDKALNDEHRRSILVTLATRRNELSNQLTDSSFSYLDLLPGDRKQYEMMIQERALRAFNELIVLFDHCTTFALAVDCLQSYMDPWISAPPSPFSSSKEAAATEAERHDIIAYDHKSPEPRRDVVIAMLQPLEESVVNQNIENSTAISFVNIPGQLYGMILDRVSIPETEWYTAFARLHQPVNNDHHLLYRLFACGIRHLQIAGLIRRRRTIGTKTNGIVYEKTALVWCGGD